MSFLLFGCVHSFSSQGSPLVTKVEAESLQSMPGTNVLVFSKTDGFRHSSIEPAIQLLQTTATERKWNLVTTEGTELFTSEALPNFDVVVFLMTSGNILNSEEQAAFEQFVRRGGGYAGVHSASDTEYDWDWYGGLVGAYFKDHPPIQAAEINKSSELHLSTNFLPTPWIIKDEWYNFRSNPIDNSNINVLLWLDEASYTGGTMGGQHPIAWYQSYDGGRAWYTAIGHRAEHYSSGENKLFQQHLIEGIEWAAGKNYEPIDPSLLTEKIYLPLSVSN